MTDKHRETGLELERRLRELYRRENLPEGLGERILARARGKKVLPRRRMSAGAWLRRHARLVSLGSGLATVLVLAAVGAVHRHEAAREQARRAQAQLAYALQTVTRELHWAETNVNQDLAVPKAVLPAAGHSKGVQHP